MTNRLANSKLPKPPEFPKPFEPGVSFTVPPFQASHEKTTRYVLNLFTCPSSLNRLPRLALKYPDLFCDYYQVPDRPEELIFASRYGRMSACDLQPAYHKNSILYLNVVGLAVYLKHAEILKILMKIKKDSGEYLFSPNGTCFVQKCFKRGLQRGEDDLCNTTPALLAVRRNFPEAIRCLMERGYPPQRPFCLIYRKPYSEGAATYRDLIDYALELLQQRPGTNVASLMTIITSAPQRTKYDIFMYEVVGSEDPCKGDWISCFRSAVNLGLKHQYYTRESGMAIISLLEVIHRLGFFTGFDSQLMLRDQEYGGASNAMVQFGGRMYRKISGAHLLRLPSDVRGSKVAYDRMISVGMLVVWYQETLRRKHRQQICHLERLLANIFLDTFDIEMFFTYDNHALAEKFAIWSQCGVKIEPVVIEELRGGIQRCIASSESLLGVYSRLFKRDTDAILHPQMVVRVVNDGNANSSDFRLPIKSALANPKCSSIVNPSENADALRQKEGRKLSFENASNSAADVIGDMPCPK